ERRGPVTIARGDRDRRERRHAQPEEPPAPPRRYRAGLRELLEDTVQRLAEVDRDDRRGRFVGAEPVIVAGVRYARAEQRLMPIDCAEDRRAEEEELQILVRAVTGLKEVLVTIADRPVQ